MTIDLNPELKAPWVPDVGVRFVPEPEKSYAEAFYFNLYELQKWSDDFACSFALFGFCCDQPPGEIGPTTLNLRWRLMAARNGGLALRNFGQCLAAARGIVGKVGFWEGKIKLKDLKAVEVEFRNKFPNIDKLRHAIAHPEFYANPQIDMTGTATDMPGLAFDGNIVVQDAISFSTYATTINGITVYYELTFENARFLLDLTRRAYATVDQIVREAAEDTDKIEHPI